MTAASAGEDFGRWRTLREIDAATGRPKGTAFRAFRTLAEDASRPLPEARWLDGRDYRLFRRHQHPDVFDRLAGRLYAGSLTAILVSPAMAAEIEGVAGADGNARFP